jgi:hypothetical protein|nr:DUF4337 domain-containing protein [Kofleriaceae bacterium]
MEEELETAELKEKIDEHLEHAEHAEHAAHGGHGGAKDGPKWTRYLSLSTAMIAVFAAVTALLSGHFSNDAILQKSDAADKWAEYQANRIKMAIADNQADLVSDRPDAFKKSKEQAAHYDEKSKEIMKDAKEHDDDSDAMMSKHQRFAITVTMLQIAIALSAIAALTKKKEMWFVGLAVSAVSLVTFVLGLLA